MRRRLLPKWSVGSTWNRWDPHLHAPGTLRNDQFGGDWRAYLQEIESARPSVVGLGITDYFCLRTYKETRRRTEDGTLRGVLIFPNVELRLTIETHRGQGINLHLLVNPDDQNHVSLFEEQLGQLKFEFQNNTFPCTEEGLRRLGRQFSGDKALPDEAALEHGANQFKVELSALQRLFKDSKWVRENVLVAVAAGADGLSGISKDAAFCAQREELGRFAHIVFSGNPNDRKYWLGGHPDFETKVQSLKPCLHGSDAHELNAVLQPVQDRRCWIRATPTFEGLRQTLVEPDRRVHIGEAPPMGPAPCDTIRYVRVKNASWLENEELHMNDGLVTIIGAKGSGKTALADLVAFAAYAEDCEPGPGSFIAKAGELLNDILVELEWADGSKSSRSYGDEFSCDQEPRVRYLSQQFVERLCSPEALGKPLVDEIERVVFSAIPDEDRLECTSFDELRRARVEDHLAERDVQRESIRNQTGIIAKERATERSIPSLKTKVASLERERVGLENELKAVPLKVDEKKLKVFQDAKNRLLSLKASIAAAERRAKELAELRAEMVRQVGSVNLRLGELRSRFSSIADETFWPTLVVRLPDDVEKQIEKLEKTARLNAQQLRNCGSAEVGGSGFIDAMGLASAEEEFARQRKELGEDETKVAKRGDIEKRLASTQYAESKAQTELGYAEKASERLKVANGVRLQSYEAVFKALVEEEQALTELYAPLRKRIGRDDRLSKLSFNVHRDVNIGAWAEQGESLLDLRRTPFQRGQLADVARKSMLDEWRRGTPESVREAMRDFISKHASGAVDALARGVSPQSYGEWLFSTEHIEVRYGIQYEGVDVVNLSPGTRGVVLLSLYLGLDEWDLRPLVIDQPEENLDPRSIYNDLAPFFREAARRRQVFMVTHNANLVVNTDSGQVIVADARRRSPSELPLVRYVAGGLEDPDIRASVCQLLEGGEAAFKKRSARYGVTN